MKTIYNNIYFHPLFFVVVIISVLTGLFQNIIIFTFIILVHETGHFLAGKFLNWEVEKICIYPYGGCTKFKSDLNKPIIEEVIILIFGPFTQVTAWFIFKSFLTGTTLNIFNNYNESILIFNLLPLYILDGGKLFNLFLECFISYKKSMYISIIISFVFSMFLLFYNFSFTFYLVMFFIISKLFDQYKMIKYIFNKFLMERYLKKYKFKKLKVVKSLDLIMRNKKHVIKYNGKYETESKVLKRKYTSNV